MAGNAPQPYEGWIEADAAKYGVPVSVFREQIRQESGFNPGARSPAGAEGIAQFMPGTASGLGIDPWNAMQALDGAAKLDAQYLKQFGGDVSKMLAAYNAGPGAVQSGAYTGYAETTNYIKSIESASGVSGIVSGVQAAGLSLNPLDDIQKAANAAAGAVLNTLWGAVRPTILTGTFVAAGAGIIGMGLWRAAKQASQHG